MPRLSVIIFIALLIWLVPINGARTYIVDDDGFADYKTIGEAVVAASNGDTIYVKPGTYQEEVLLNKSVSIMPLSGESDPIVLKGDGRKTGITIAAKGCTLEGLTLENFTGPAISIQSSENIIQKNRFEKDNPAVLISNSHLNAVINNIMKNCQGGVALQGNSTENNIQENQIGGGDVSILLWNCPKNNIVNNQATGATWGIWLKDSQEAKIDGNQVKSKTYGIWLQNSTTTRVDENDVSFEEEMGVSSVGIFLANTSKIELSGNDVMGGAFSIGISDSEANNVRDNAMEKSSQGIYILNSSGQVVSNNKIMSVVYGITLENSSENLIKQCNIENCSIGLGLGTSNRNRILENSILNITDTAIQMASSRENNLSRNRISKGENGIIMSESANNRLQDNIFREITWSLYVESSWKEGFDNTIASSNLVDGKPVAYVYSQSGLLIQNKELAHLTLAYCDNITVENTAITNDALFLFNSKDNKIQENNVSNCYGVRLVNSTANEISGNNLSSNRYSGLFLVSSDSNQIDKNIASENNQNGISLLGSQENIIRDNVVSQNHDTGIWLNYSDYNQILQNNISDNPLGMQIMSSSGNQIYHNNFINNKEHSQDTAGNNSWDLGNVTGGNYWSDHVAKGNPSQNWPRMIKGGKIDRYPFQDVSGWI